MATPRNKIKANLDRVRTNIAAACQRSRRDERDITLVAVTKGGDVQDIATLIELGVRDIAESRVSQLAQRRADIESRLGADLAGEIRWHLVGHLQRNKVRQALEVADFIHSVDTLRLAEEISARCVQAGKVAKLLLEVNCSQEPQKFGVAVGAAVHLADMLGTLKNVKLVGLMTMAAATDNPENARPTFARLAELFEEMRSGKIGGPDFKHLSMGMSQDYPVAVEEGATLIRVGSALVDQVPTL